MRAGDGEEEGLGGWLAWRVVFDDAQGKPVKGKPGLRILPCLKRFPGCVEVLDQFLSHERPGGVAFKVYLFHAHGLGEGVPCPLGVAAFRLEQCPLEVMLGQVQSEDFVVRVDSCQPLHQRLGLIEPGSGLATFAGLAERSGDGLILPGQILLKAEVCVTVAAVSDDAVLGTPPQALAIQTHFHRHGVPGNGRYLVVRLAIDAEMVLYPLCPGLGDALLPMGLLFVGGGFLAGFLLLAVGVGNDTQSGQEAQEENEGCCRGRPDQRLMPSDPAAAA